MEINISWDIFNPLFYHLRKYISDPNIRTILLYGGSGSAKTYTVLQTFNIVQLTDHLNCAIVRKQGNMIDKTVFSEAKKMALGFNKAIDSEYFNVIRSPWEIRTTKSRTVFFGVADPEQLKGLADFHIVFMNELNLFDKEDKAEVDRRLRGMPNQKIIADWNPVDESSWVKKELIDYEIWHDAPLHTDGYMLSKLDDSSSVKINDRGDMVLIKTTYLDNRWITGSDLPNYGFKDIHQMRNFEILSERDPMHYRVYGLGEWGTLRVEDSFWSSFNQKIHVSRDKDRVDEVIHLTVDINRLPYITQCFWVYKSNTKELVQFNELLATTPNNEAERAADLVISSMKSINYTGVLFLYGDASGNNRDAKDNKSFFTVYKNRLKTYFGESRLHDRIWTSNPSISISAAFINSIYAGDTPFSIYINARCNESITDYSIVEKDKDGNMLKKKFKDKRSGHTIEKNGHISDTKRYFICKILQSEYDKYRKNPQQNRMVYVGD